MVANVLLHITGNSLDIWSCVASGDAVDNFVGGDEHQQIGVLGEHVNGGEYAL